MMKSHNFFLTLVMGLSLSIYNCSGKADSSLGEKLIQVRAQQVKACDGSESLAYSGTIEESESVSHSFSSLGTVSRVYVAEGDAVRKGQLLAEINDATYRNTYQMTRATEEQAEDGLQTINAHAPERQSVRCQVCGSRDRVAPGQSGRSHRQEKFGRL